MEGEKNKRRRKESKVDLGFKEIVQMATMFTMFNSSI